MFLAENMLLTSFSGEKQNTNINVPPFFGICFSWRLWVMERTVGLAFYGRQVINTGCCVFVLKRYVEQWHTSSLTCIPNTLTDCGSFGWIRFLKMPGQSQLPVYGCLSQTITNAKDCEAIFKQKQNTKSHSCHVVRFNIHRLFNWPPRCRDSKLSVTDTRKTLKTAPNVCL